MEPTKIEATYADLRDDDLLVAKDGARWHVSGVTPMVHDMVAVSFWLGDARTKVRAHHLTKPAGEPCTVWRITKHADDVKALEDGSTLPDPSVGRMRTTAEEQAALEAAHPKAWAPAGTVNDTFLPDPGASDPTSSPPVPAAGTRPLPGVASPEEDARRAALVASFVARADTAPAHEAARLAVEAGMPGAVVEVDVTAAEVDAARVATDDEPVEVPLFESMTDLEQRSHLYVLHGIFAQDVEDRIERMKLHVACHRDQAANKIRGRHTPHVHVEGATR